MTHNIALLFPKIVTTQVLVGISFFSLMSREMPWSLFTAQSEMYISINNVAVKGHTQDIIPLIHASALHDVTPNRFVQYLLHVFSFTWQAVISEIESLQGIFQDNKMTAISIFDRRRHAVSKAAMTFEQIIFEIFQEER